jgi:hypothetical protein
MVSNQEVVARVPAISRYITLTLIERQDQQSAWYSRAILPVSGLSLYMQRKRMTVKL